MSNLAPAKTFTFKSIKTKLLISFLLLGLLPLNIALWVSYSNSSNSVHEIIQNELKYNTPLSVNFILNWFDYRTRDISDWSKAPDSISFMHSLTYGFEHSGMKLDQYTQSTAYHELVDKYQNNYMRHAQTYPYIYDIFLIDLKGNILFTIKKESDYATNLFNAALTSTRFALSFRQVLNDKKIHFSDFERYTPSKNNVYGFISAPVFDENNALIGVFSVQFKPERIFNSFKILKSGRPGMSQYLVGKDGFLRSSINSEDEILIRKINTEQLSRYQMLSDSPEHDDNLLTYIGPEGKIVSGIHHDLNILGVQWGLITEMDEEIVLSSTHDLTRKFLIIMGTSTFILFIVAWVIAHKITSPLHKLSENTLSIAQGRDKKIVDINTNDEIGQLAASFNIMIKQLKERSEETYKALHALKEQKLALDAHVIVSVTNIDGTISYVNQKFIDISAFSASELIGHKHNILSSDIHDEAFWKEMFTVIRKGGTWHDEICNKKKNGDLYWVDTTILPFANEKGKIKSYISLSTDITDRKKKEKQLIQQSHLAQMGEMISMIAHQWRQPLSAISAVSSQIRLALDLNKFQFYSDEESKKCHDFFNKELHDIDSYVQNLTTTINDFRNFYKPNKTPVNLMLEEPVEKALHIIKASIDNSNITIEKEFLSQTLLPLFDTEMMQVVLSLLKNAQDALIENKTANPVIILRTFDTEDGAVLEIQDNAGGINEEVIERIFEPYFSTKNEKNGTGLGLYMSKTIIEDHHKGNLSACNRDKGACFTIKLYHHELESL